MTMSENIRSIVKEGYLFCLRGKNISPYWCSRYYVLYGKTEKNLARLDYYDNLEDFLQDIKNTNSGTQTKTNFVRRTIYLEEIVKIVSNSSFNKSNCFELQRKETDSHHVLAAEDEFSYNCWIKQLKFHHAEEVNQKLVKNSTDNGKLRECVLDPCSSLNDNFFEVRISRTAASDNFNLSGTYSLILTPQELVLTCPKSGKELLVWPYKSIRRYGKGSRSFSIEAGRKCQSGEGIYSFETDESSTIFNTIQNYTQSIKEQENNKTSATSGTQVCNVSPPRMIFKSKKTSKIIDCQSADERKSSVLPPSYELACDVDLKVKDDQLESKILNRSNNNPDEPLYQIYDDSNHGSLPISNLNSSTSDHRSAMTIKDTFKSSLDKSSEVFADLKIQNPVDHKTNYDHIKVNKKLVDDFKKLKNTVENEYCVIKCDQ